MPDVALVLLEPASPSPRPAPPSPRGRVPAWTEAWTADDHIAAVGEVRERIARGDVYQVNLVAGWSGPVVGPVDGLLDPVLDLPGAVWRGAIAGDGWAVASASPENLLRVLGGRISSRPVKGTLAVGTDRVASRAALLASGKDRAEHVMIVDLVRNDLARVTDPGSIAVPELFVVEEWAGLWHAHSTVTGQVRAGTGLAEVLRAVLPGGSVTGAPKRAALEVIDALEPVGRGPAMGALGWIDRSGRLELGLTIRTAALDTSDPDRPVAALWAGGGITWGSDPAGERAEALAKARPLLEVLARG